MSKTSSQSGFEVYRLKYDDPSLDRAGPQRDDPDWLESALAHAHARSIPVWRNQSLVDGVDGASPSAVLRGVALHEHASEIVFLGLDGETPVFAADYSDLDEHEVADLVGRGFTDLRKVGPLLSEPA